VESTLGRDALTRGIYAGIIGFALIIIFMVAYYRGLGLISIFGLMVYIFIFWGVISALGAALTLPGIAGIILTIGMAVDANIIIYERIREEVRKGKTPYTALNAGFKNAMRTIIDANVTTLITAAALFRFGTGPVRGFAVTLGLGVIISMVTAILLVRAILYLIASNRKIMRPGFLGIKGMER
jgi:preprotein translocase subunit SecD